MTDLSGKKPVSSINQKAAVVIGIGLILWTASKFFNRVNNNAESEDNNQSPDAGYFSLISPYLNLIKEKKEDFDDFTIRSSTPNVKNEKKELLITAHGKLLNKHFKLYDSPFNVYMHAEKNRAIFLSSATLYKFQTRREDLVYKEVFNKGGKHSDYELSYSDLYEDSHGKIIYHSKLLNRDLINGVNQSNNKIMHDVLTIKPGKTIKFSSLVERLDKIPHYNKVHALFCRARVA